MKNFYKLLVSDDCVNYPISSFLAYDVIKGEQSDDYDKYGEEFLRKQKG